MEALFIYIIKSSGLMLLFYCAYFFLLRKETFFNSNRWFLLSGLIVSAILPLVTYTKVIWINAAPQFNTDFQNFVSNASQDESSEFNWNYVILGLYTVGLLIFLIKLAIDFYSLNSIIKGKKIKQQADFKFIDINENIAPFSYFEYIVYNSSLYTPSELESILEHEKVHSDQNHTLDVLVSRIFSIIFWFNPIVWLYKKAIMQNLEFIADSEAAKKIQDKKAYQYTLLKITTHENCVAITNHFYQSLIKKRIVMLNKNQSKRRNYWKYYAVIPALVAFVLLFQIEVVAKERQPNAKVVSTEIESVDVYKILKNSTDAELKEIKEKLKKLHNINFEVSQIKRNSENELTSIKVDIINGSDKSQSIQTGGDKTIKDFGIIVITDKNGKKKAGIQTSDEKITISKKVSMDGKTNKNSERKTITTNTESNVNTNSITSTKTNSDTNTNISTTVIINKDNNTKVITTGTSTAVAVSNGAKTNVKISSSLVIVNGEEMPAGFDVKSIPNDNIESVSIFTGVNATEKYGSKAANGVIEIETKN
ncbi:M56 family metallopeptidase [Flavobacterium sp. HBTb2-11-1]|uniref:M56 family metallopeptidase n=1 Tax=Flavobacterium sp. HBTb2-11-1 TaxID=2692212 RepID=UPI00136DE085|nr:M56 family metallopeptidase [Flavobacterium sp. HBTb2-11-1]MXO07437.1 M56 family peptidase [Flavobacterium sp. HBTb2-11-1]